MKKWSQTRTITAVAVVMSVKKSVAGQSPSLKCPRRHPSRLKLKLLFVRRLYKESVFIHRHKIRKVCSLQLLGKPSQEISSAETSEEIFGQKIPMEVSERWGKILTEGLTKEQKKNMLTKTLIPENFYSTRSSPRRNHES
ncbi:unnamed protein product [Parnassius apollo]|uniref:(apollo) hypothetical protein n=1 Tax=Parnassius apollo TaxID=110799 RepID=A0A8S3Y8G4_PARAO|nr:unnamed protein product [Parnassius apollo]